MQFVCIKQMWYLFMSYKQHTEHNASGSLALNCALKDLMHLKVSQLKYNGRKTLVVYCSFIAKGSCYCVNWICFSMMLLWLHRLVSRASWCLDESTLTCAIKLHGCLRNIKTTSAVALADIFLHYTKTHTQSHTHTHILSC